ncbi:MAG: tetratricopeptide repeat protein [Blastocatellia bacterium]|nr:tetratricopeptide repeat protein [Blastocatellia bacterium]
MLTKVDSPNGVYGPEPISVIAESSSSYRLEVRSLEKDARAGRYEVKVSELRTATAEDRSRVMAERVYAEGISLESQGDADSLRKAIEKYKEALGLYKTVGMHQGEGDTLHEIGVILGRLGENRKALDYYNQALPHFQAVGDRRGEGLTLNDIGVSYYSLGEMQKALDYYHRAIPLERVVGDRGGEAATLTSIGAAYYSLGEMQKALDYYNQGLPLFRIVADRGREAIALQNIGTVYSSLGEIQKALDYHNQALALSRAVGDRGQEAVTLTSIGVAYYSLGEMQKTLDYLNQALPLMRAVGDRSQEVRTLSGIGLAYDQLGEKQKALDYFNQALLLSRAVGNRGGEAVTLSSIGHTYDSLGEKQKALDYLNQALTLSRAVGDRTGEASTLNGVGVLYYSLGEKQKALDYLNQALTLSRAVGARSEEASTLNSIGVVYYSLGEMQKALDYYNQALTLSRAVGDRSQEAVTLSSIGVAYYSLGEMQKALDYYNQALTLKRAVGNPRGAAVTLNNIGKVYDSLGKKEKALDYYNQALTLSRAVGDRTGEAITLSNIGFAYDSLGEKQKALDYYNQALPLSQAVGARDVTAKTLLGMARTESAQGKLLEARSTIESALNIIESLRTEVVNPELRSSYFATTQDFYEFSIDLLMRLHKLQADRGYDREALLTAERARARSLLDILVESRLEIRRGTEPALIERERALGQLLSAKTERQMLLLNGKHTEQQAAAVADEIKALTAQYQDLEVEIRKKSPGYAALTQPQPLKPEEIQREVLDDQTLLLEYFLGKERSFLWIVSANSIRSCQLPKREEIEEQALRVKKLLTARATREKGESPEQRQARIAEAEAKYWEEAARLSEKILGPAASELRGKRLAIVPDGELQEVAFGALPVPGAEGSGKKTIANKKGGGRLTPMTPMIVEHEIVSLPSASALAVLRRDTSGREPSAKVLAVLADPVFDKDDGRIKLAHAAGTEKKDETETEALASRDLLRATRDVMGEETRFGRLPFSRREAEAILSVTPKTASLEALDFKASRATATSDELSQYRIVHFATHGFVDKLHPELSGVVLSLVDQEGRPQNGFLQLHDVYNLNLPAELVVLSACQTGLGKSVRGEGLVGLTRGFMYAGAKRVVASLWSVQDLATAELMKRFYGAMLGEKGMRPAAALREAQVEMWKQTRRRSPYYWGGFTLYGEW